MSRVRIPPNPLFKACDGLYAELSRATAIAKEELGMKAKFGNHFLLSYGIQ